MYNVQHKWSTQFLQLSLTITVIPVTLSSFWDAHSTFALDCFAHLAHVTVLYCPSSISTEVIKSQPQWPFLLHSNLMCVNSCADFHTSCVFTIIHSTQNPLVYHRCAFTILSQILSSTAIRYLITTGPLQKGTQRLYKHCLSHIWTENFVKYYALSVSIFCSLKVISAIENSILGHNYITSTAKNCSCKGLQKQFWDCHKSNTSQCSHHLLNLVHSMYKAYTYFDGSCIILYIPHTSTKC